MSFSETTLDAMLIGQWFRLEDGRVGQAVLNLGFLVDIRVSILDGDQLRPQFLDRNTPAIGLMSAQVTVTTQEIPT